MSGQNMLVEIVRIVAGDDDGVLDSVRQEIDILTRGLELNAALLKNGGKGSIWINWKDAADNDEIAARTKSIKDTISGAAYGSIIGTAGEATALKDIGVNPKDMDFAQLKMSCEKAVYLACGVPLPLVFNEAATDNNVHNAKLMFFTDTCIPLCNNIYGAIGLALSRREKKVYAIVVNENAIPAMRSERVKQVQTMQSTYTYTINELREMQGLEVQDGADKLLVPSSMIDIQSVGATP